MKDKKLFTKKELQAFGEFAWNIALEKVFEIIDQVLVEDYTKTLKQYKKELKTELIKEMKR